jgi:hypothetical protein
MSQEFTAATTDNITGTITAVNTGPFTLGCWFYPPSDPSLGRALCLGTGTVEQSIYFNGTLHLRLLVNYSTLAVQRDATYAAYNAWNCVCAVYNDSLTPSNHQIYTGTPSVAMADTTTGAGDVVGTGTRSTGLTNGRIGNRSSAQDRPFNGRIADAFMVPWAMTRDEAEQFRLGSRTVLFAHGQPRFWLPLKTGTYDVGGGTGLWTATGTVVTEDPPIRAGWG